MAILLINTIYSDREFVSDVVDDSHLSVELREFFESKANGTHIAWNSPDMEWLDSQEFDIDNYEETALPSIMFGENAKIDKIINIDH